jgi:tRNA modification GTPase
MKRSNQIMKNAELMLYVVDSTVGAVQEDNELIEAYARSTPVITLWNKSDLSDRPPPAGYLSISARTGEGLNELHLEIGRRVLGAASAADSGEPVIDSSRQKKHLQNTLGALESFSKGLDAGLPLDILAVDLREALDNLGELTGKIVSADILHEMFSRFCVGK